MSTSKNAPKVGAKTATGSEETPEASPRRSCFIITPIGDENSPTRRATDGLIRSVIEPVASELNYDATAAHDLSVSGSITKQVVERVLNADMVIANLTDLNPNVMYELALRHAAKKPVVILAHSGTRLPFDVADQRTIFFSNDIMGGFELRERLRKALAEAQVESQTDNPVTAAVRDFELLKTVPSGSPERLVIDRLNDLSRQVGRISAAVRGQPNAQASWTGNDAPDLLLEFDSFVEHQRGLEVLGKALPKSFRVFSLGDGSVLIRHAAPYRSLVESTLEHNGLTLNSYRLWVRDADSDPYLMEKVKYPMTNVGNIYRGLDGDEGS